MGLGSKGQELQGKTKNRETEWYHDSQKVQIHVSYQKFITSQVQITSQKVYFLIFNNEIPAPLLTKYLSLRTLFASVINFKSSTEFFTPQYLALFFMDAGH